MQWDRRSFVAGAVLAGCLAKAGTTWAQAPAREPLLHRVRRGAGIAYILGYSEAVDTSWFTARIEAALGLADVLWLETPPGSAAAAAEGQASPPPADPELERLLTVDAYDRARDLFAVLPAETSRRTAEWAGELGLARGILAPMRPWFARIAIQQAYAARKQATAPITARPVSPERIVVDRARRRGLPIESEYPTFAALMRFFAMLPEAAQPEYLQELFDYFDRDRAGTGDAGKYGWLTGQPSSRSIDEQRERTPNLYRAMHIERNAWWSGRIEGLLAEGRTAFLMLGQNHTLGPDSVQANLLKRGLAVEAV